MNITQLNKGLAGYSNRGTKGNQGVRGSNVYYCPYDISENAQTVKSLIENGNQLSNNPTVQTEKEISYDNGDYVIDVFGNVFEIRDGSLNKLFSFFSYQTTQQNSDVPSLLTIHYSVDDGLVPIKNTYNRNRDYDSLMLSHRTSGWENMNCKLLVPNSDDVSTFNEEYGSSTPFIKFVCIFKNGYRLERIIDSSLSDEKSTYNGILISNECMIMGKTGTPLGTENAEQTFDPSTDTSTYIKQAHIELYNDENGKIILPVEIQ